MLYRQSRTVFIAMVLTLAALFVLPVNSVGQTFRVASAER